MQIFAHRGASADLPENTLSAFEEAIRQGADGIELDVFPCEDEFVIIHDKWVHRTTNGQGQVRDFTFKELRELNAGNGQTIPTLGEALSLIGNRCQINIEVKVNCCTESLVSYIKQYQQAADISDSQIIISSFIHPTLLAIKRYALQWRYGALTASYAVSGNQFAQDLGAWSVNIDLNVTDKALVSDAHERGLKVFVYTVDEPDDLEELKSWGVDGVFTNKPANSRRLLGI
ncbi:glycerophosphodiester phosphodiesterase [Alteromonadaceae bacterium M269]|nr:glycerophosphodiester phosphodiesterase [Alteromonadaceae bacterium M269]